jgi:hypothetical protein
MDEPQERDKAEYLVNLFEALEEAASHLSEVAAIELRRRLDTTSAIIRSARPAFLQALTIKGQLHRRRESLTPHFFMLGCLVVGGALHYVFRDPTKTFDLTFGALILGCGLVSSILYVLKTYRLERALERHLGQIDELLYRWIANGGSEDRFWQLRTQVNVDAGDIDMDTDTYRRWSYETKADLVDSINGETPGSWRPRFFGW